jgi:hypothetical protein
MSFADAVAQQKTSDPLQQGLKILKRNLREKIVDRTSAAVFGPATHAGYRERSGDNVAIVVHTSAFGGWFTNKAQRNAVLGWLAARGLLKRAAGAVAGRLKPKDTLGVLRRWPSGRLVRSFEFADPSTGVKVSKASYAQAVAPSGQSITRSGPGGASKMSTAQGLEFWPVDENGRHVYAN